MSVATVKAAIVVMQKLITGVKTAYAQAPASLNTADLPMFVNLTSVANQDWEGLGDGGDYETRVYLMRLYVLQGVLGIPGEAERLCEPFFTSVRDYFAARPFLNGTHGVQYAYVIGDSGVTRLVFDNPETPLLGIEFKLQVKEQIQFTYAE
jgi:hypothetical protein